MSAWEIWKLLLKYQKVHLYSYFKQLHNQSENALGKEKIFMKRLYVNEMWL